MRWCKISVILCTGLLYCFVSHLYSQDQEPQIYDTTKIYDPFGPENSTDHSGMGSGGVITPSPYENVIQTYYTRISADYNGIQHMHNSTWQFSTGLSWSSYQNEIFGILFKARTSGFSESFYDLVVEDTISSYQFPFEVSFDYSINKKDFQAFKSRLHWETYTKSLGMAGIGVLVSNWNLTLVRDLSMDRKWGIELTWTKVAGGYIMPLSPKVGGKNISICGAVDLLGAKVQYYNSNKNKFYGAKIGSIGWLIGAGWNTFSTINLSAYVGGEWNFSTGVLKLPTSTIVRADIIRNTLNFGMQLTSHYFNLSGGIQKEWEYLDYLKTVISEKSLRYYLGANIYFQR